MSSLSLALFGLTGQVALLALIVCAVHQCTKRNNWLQASELLFGGIVGCMFLTLLICAPLPSWIEFQLVDSGQTSAITENSVAEESKISERNGSSFGIGGQTGSRSRESDVDPIVLDTPEPTDHAEEHRLNAAGSGFGLKLNQLLSWISLPLVAASVLGMTRLLHSMWWLRSLLQNARSIDDEAILDCFERVQRSLGVTGPVGLRTSAAVESAAMIGWRKPVILLGEDYSNWTSDQIRDVFAHELAHIKHKDFFRHCVCRLVTALHFGNPFIHLLARRLLLCQELAADRVANDLNPDSYTRSLAQLALSNQDNSRFALGLFNRPAFISRRIDMLKNNPTPVAQQRIRGLRLIVVIAAFVLGGFRFSEQMRPSVQAATPNQDTSEQLQSVTGQAEQNDEQDTTDNTKPNWQDREFVKPDNFTITILDSDTKQGIPNATITAWGIDHAKENSTQTLMEVKTNDQGRCQFQGLQEQYPTVDQGEPGPQIVLGIKCTEYSTTVIQPANSLEYLENPNAFSINLRLAEGLKGRVVDDNGDPIAGAKVWNHIFLPQPIDGFYSVTDETGHFYLEDSTAFREQHVSNNRIMSTLFYIEHPEFGRSQGMVTFRPSNDGPIQFKLNRVVKVDGFITCDAKSSINAIQMWAYPIHSRRGDSSTDEFARTEPTPLVAIPDKNGNFSLRLPSDFEYYLTAVDPKREVGAPAIKVTGGAGQTLILPEIKIEPMVSVSGYVVDPDSKDRIAIEEGLEVHLMWHGEDYPKGISPVRFVLIKPDGSFEAKMVPGQNYPYIATVSHGKRYASNRSLENGITVGQTFKPTLVMELEITEYKNEWE